jgi:hypothetical protein
MNSATNQHSIWVDGCLIEPELRLLRLKMNNFSLQVAAKAYSKQLTCRTSKKLESAHRCDVSKNKIDAQSSRSFTWHKGKTQQRRPLFCTAPFAAILLPI